MHTTSDQPGDMRDIGHKQCTTLVGDLAEPCEINHARVGRVPAQDHLRLVFQTNPSHSVVVDLLEPVSPFVVTKWIMNGLVVLAGDVDLHPVAEVPAIG